MRFALTQVRQFLQAELESCLGDLYQFGLLQGEDAARALRRALGRTCTDVLPDAVALVDAFAFQDWELDRCACSLYTSLSLQLC